MPRRRIELRTFCLPCKCSTNWATWAIRKLTLMYKTEIFKLLIKKGASTHRIAQKKLEREIKRAESIARMEKHKFVLPEEKKGPWSIDTRKEEKKRRNVQRRKKKKRKWRLYWINHICKKILWYEKKETKKARKSILIENWHTTGASMSFKVK